MLFDHVTLLLPKPIHRKCRVLDKRGNTAAAHKHIFDKKIKIYLQLNDTNKNAERRSVTVPYFWWGESEALYASGVNELSCMSADSHLGLIMGHIHSDTWEERPSTCVMRINSALSVRLSPEESVHY